MPDSAPPPVPSDERSQIEQRTERRTMERAWAQFYRESRALEQERLDTLRELVQPLQEAATGITQTVEWMRQVSERLDRTEGAQAVFLSRQDAILDALREEPLLIRIMDRIPATAKAIGAAGGGVTLWELGQFVVQALQHGAAQ